MAIVATVGGMLFGFDISSMSAIIDTQQYVDYFNNPHGTTQGGIGAALAGGSVPGMSSNHITYCFNPPDPSSDLSLLKVQSWLALCVTGLAAEMRLLLRALGGFLAQRSRLVVMVLVC